MVSARSYDSESDYYESTWSDDARGIHFERHRPLPRMKDLLEEFFVPGKRMLDVGTGAGKYAVAAACVGYTATGVDFSPSALELAREFANRSGVVDLCHFKLGDVLALELGERFDVITDGGCLHHIRRKSWPDYFSSVRRHLSPNGRWIASIYSKRSTLPEFSPAASRRTWTVWRGHYTYFATREALLRALPSFLEVEEITEVPYYDRTDSFRFVVSARLAG